MPDLDGKVKIGGEFDSSEIKKGITGLGSLAKTGFGVVSAAATATAAGVTALGGYAYKVGSDFETATSQIAATMGKPKSEIQAVIDKASELGRTTSFSATQAAEGMNILAQSGLQAEDMIAAMPSVLNLAKAGTLSLDQAASYVTGSVKGYSASMEDAGYFADLMAKGATLANTNVNALGAALSSSAATSASYGQTADRTALALLRLAEQNVTGSEAATALNRAMMDLYTPTEGAAKALNKLGIAAYTEKGEARDFNTVVDELAAALSTMSDEEANATKNAIFTTFGLQAFNKMTVSSTEKVEEFTEGLKACGGSAAEQAKTMEDNLQGAITFMSSAAEGFGVSLYQNMVGPLTDLVKYGTDAITQLTEAFQTGGVDGLVQAGAQIITNVLIGVTEHIPDAVDMVVQILGQVITTINENLPKILEAGENLLNSLVEGVTTLMPSIVELGKNILTHLINTLIEHLPNLVQTGIDMLLDFALGIVENLPSIVDTGIQILMAIVQGIVNALPSLIQKGPELINRFTDVVYSTLGKIIQAGIDIIVSLGKGIMNNVGLIIQNAGEIVKAIFNIFSLFSLANVGTKIMGTLSGGIQSAIQGLKNLASSIVQQLKSPFNLEGWASIGANIIDGIATGIQNGIGSLVDMASSAAAAAFNAVANFFGIASPSKLMRDVIGKNMIAGAVKGIEEETPEFENATQESAGKAVRAMQAVSEERAIKTTSHNEKDRNDDDRSGEEDKPKDGGTVVVPVYIDGREVARGTAPYMAEQLSFEGAFA